MPGIRTKPFKAKLKRGPAFNLYQRIFDHIFSPCRKGRLTVFLPDGRRLVYGRGEAGVQATIRVHHHDFFKRCILFGDVGFGESYVDGEWESDDLTRLIEWMIINVEDHPTLMDTKQKRAPVNFFKIANNLLSFYRRNTLGGSRKNISHHYDLGNEFYQLMLDPTMTYSAAYFKSDRDTLQEAQLAKYEELCMKLRLKETDHVLEIGSGWGGFAIYAAKNFGCRVTTATISQEQFAFAKKRIDEEGLTAKIDILLSDYRLLEGKFDKIVSIEMIEAVGHQYYTTYFEQIHRLLKKDGLFAIQAILSPDHRYDSFRKNMDFIQKHIFPGSLLPSMAIILRSLNATGDLNLLDYKDMTIHYAKTLNIWRENFLANNESIRSQGFDDAFIRQWHYYLCYCESAFKTRNIYVAQMVFSRPNNTAVV